MAPTSRLNAIPHATDCTLRANHPAAMPAIIPLTVEPMTMPMIPARTAGVNHAVAPSTAPRAAPSRSPTRILFMLFLRRTYSTSAANPLTVNPENDDGAHGQIREDDGNKGAVARQPAPGALDDVFAIGADRLVVEPARDVVRELARALITSRFLRRGCFRADRIERAREFRGQDGSQHRSEGEDIGGGVDRFAALLLRSHEAARSSDPSVARTGFARHAPIHHQHFTEVA